MATTERLYQFPSKASPVPADIIYVGDSADAFNEVQSTIAQIIAAYPNLSGIAGLTLGANTYPYVNSGATFTAGTITALGVSLIANTTAAGMRSTLGVVIGTDVEAHSVALDSIAALVTAANTMLYTTASNTYAVIAAANSSVLISSAGGVPSMSQTLPSAVQTNITALGTQGQALNMGSHLINNVTDPSGAQDAATKNYVDTTFLPLAGGTMTGAVSMGSHKITSLTDPTSAQDAATKNYVDTVAQGLTIQGACYAASTANLTVTYANGAAGVGATLTNATTQAAFSVDGVSPAINSRILIKNQSSTLQNGIYTLTTVGTGASNWVLTRATDYNLAAQINPGDLIIIDNGTVNANSSWVQTATVTTIGTDPITFSQFTGQAASKSVSDNTKTVVASVSGSTTSGNLAKFADTTGTVQDSGIGSTTTGSGAVVLANTPTLITPVLGAATATSVNFGDTSLTKYKQGTFTPTITGGSTPPTSIGYSAQIGVYTQIGNVVHYALQITVNALTIGPAAGGLVIQGFPIAAVGTTSFMGSVQFDFITTDASVIGVSGAVLSGTTNANLYEYLSNAGGLAIPITALHSNSNLFMTGIYLTS